MRQPLYNEEDYARRGTLLRQVRHRQPVTCARVASEATS